MGHFTQSVFSLCKLFTLASMTAFCVLLLVFLTTCFQSPLSSFHLFHNYWFLTGIPFLNLLLLHTFSGNFTKSWIRGPWTLMNPKSDLQSYPPALKTVSIFLQTSSITFVPKTQHIFKFYFLLPLSLALLLSLYLPSYSITISHGTYYNLP